MPDTHIVGSNELQVNILVTFVPPRNLKNVLKRSENATKAFHIRLEPLKEDHCICTIRTFFEFGG